MYKIFLLCIILFFIGCNKVKKDSFIPKEYEYPDDSLLNGKTFTYQDLPNGQKYSDDCSIQYISNDKWYFDITHNDKKIYDSTIYLNDKRFVSYSSPYLEGRLLKDSIIQDTILPNGTKYGKSITSFIDKKNDSTSLNVSYTLEYLKDTDIIWNNASIHCIVIKDSSKYRYNEGKASTIYLDYKEEYYGKKMGIIKVFDYFNNRLIVSELKEIKHYEN
jgi:hypothetical protein